jgi:hypothetical protein
MGIFGASSWWDPLGVMPGEKSAVPLVPVKKKAAPTDIGKADQAKEQERQRKAQAQRQSLLRQRTKTIQTSPLGLQGSIDVTRKKTLLGE